MRSKRIHGQGEYPVRRRVVRILSASLLVSSLLSGAPGCGSDPDPQTTDDFDRQALLASLGTYVVLPTYQAFSAAAEDLHDATIAYAAALTAGDPETGTRLEEARDAWKAAMSIWQQAELYQVGPAGSSLEVTGGQDLRDEIYSWPTVSACRVDQEVVAQEYNSETFFQDELVNVYGLDALEYLLFNESLDNTCTSQATINSSGAWAALSDEEIRQRRADYANAAADYLAEMAQLLVSLWDPAQDNFLGQLATAGDDGSIYPSAQDALDEVFAAMFYLDMEVKDMKLADPAGISDSCSSATCPEALESQWAHVSRENIGQNLLGFQKLLMGDDPAVAERIGFDDFLIALEAPELAATMAADTEAALQAIAAIEGTLDDALTSDLAGVEAAYNAVKAVTDNLKSQFVTVLNLDVPEEGEADND